MPWEPSATSRSAWGKCIPDCGEPCLTWLQPHEPGGRHSPKENSLNVDSHHRAAQGHLWVSQPASPFSQHPSQFVCIPGKKKRERERERSHCSLCSEVQCLLRVAALRHSPVRTSEPRREASCTIRNLCKCWVSLLHPSVYKYTSSAAMGKKGTFIKHLLQARCFHSQNLV